MCSSDPRQPLQADAAAALTAILNEETDLQSALTRVAGWIEGRYQGRLYFCRIKGARWAFWCGSPGYITNGCKIRLTSGMGLIADQQLTFIAEWNRITEILRQTINNRGNDGIPHRER